ncbi:MAG: hypothetical protein K6F59_01775 [Gammaproteobacteria bacterium]|nr:hypothetical protein [Gammaproteobacteria bacterium]
MKKQAIFPILITLVVTALALIGSSFAWFTVANNVKISQITASAQADGVDLRLSFDAEHFYSREIAIPQNDPSIIIPETLYQVSTAGLIGDTAGLLNFFDARVNEIQNALHPELNKVQIESKLDKTVVSTSGVLSAAPLGANTTYGQAGFSYGEAEAATKPTYIVFDLYVYVGQKSDVYLYSGTEVKAQASASDTTAAQELLKSLRVAFLYEGGVAEGSYNQLSDLQNVNCVSTVDGNSASNGKLVIWEPQQTISGSNAVQTYGVSSESSEFYDAYATGSYTKAVPTYDTTQLVVNDDNSVAGKTALQAGLSQGYHKFRVYIWLEANDPDCTDAVASKYLSVDLKLIAFERND